VNLRSLIVVLVISNTQPDVMRSENKRVLIIGSGLGGLATALRLSTFGHDVTVVDKHTTPGGRLNIIKSEGFTFDLGPSFMSMSYELKELFRSCGCEIPIELVELDPIYQVYFKGRPKPFKIWKDLNKLEMEFGNIEPHFAAKAERYLARAAKIFHDTEYRVVKRNFSGTLDYILKLTRVPPKHLPYLFRSIWSEVTRRFESDEVRIIFSLIAFFLGSTPFRTPAIYSILNYTELKHDGYWTVKGGMYRLVEEIVRILDGRGVHFEMETEIVSFEHNNGKITSFIDQHGKQWPADIFIANADAAAFRGLVLGRQSYSENHLDKMDWTLAPFTIYLGVRGKIENLLHHNYFLGDNFKEYASTIFTSSISPQKPYYYVNVTSRTEPGNTPPGCENIFVLCPVPDLRFKADWSDKHTLADTIIADLSERIGYDITAHILTKKILAPDDWARLLNLYKGSGLGLAHGMNQVGGLRPSNYDEVFKNLFYVGASTVPGTGLPMVIISSKLVTERIEHAFGSLYGN
jgi:phytoene desaturase